MSAWFAIPRPDQGVSGGLVVTIDPYRVSGKFMICEQVRLSLLFGDDAVFGQLA